MGAPIRFSEALRLMRAAICVAVYGPVVDSGAPTAPPIQQPTPCAEESSCLSSERGADSLLFRRKLSIGMYSRVARQLGIGRQHVSEVANGNRRSARVEAALKAECARIEQAVADYERKFTTSSEVQP